jgi:hypothetical protein
MIRFVSAVCEGNTAQQLEHAINDSIKHEERFYAMLNVNVSLVAIKDGKYIAVLIWSYDDSVKANND